jgi:pilus assembly protein TadC
MVNLAALATGLVVWLLLPRGAAERLGTSNVARAAVGKLLNSIARLRAIPTTASVRREQRMVAALPAVCDLLAVCLEAGLPLRGAVAALANVIEGPAQPVLVKLAARVRLGVEESQAWAEQRDEPGWQQLADEVSRGVAGGLSLTSLLRSLGESARLAAHAEAQQQARSVGVRSVLPLMLCFLPAFILLGIVPIIASVVLSLF